MDPKIITEFDWWDKHTVAPGIELMGAPARHFSGRGIRRGKTLWLSFMLKTPTHHVYLGGDSGYDSHFKLIGNTYGPFDLAVLEAGQYNENWPHIHMMPEETVQACIDLRTKMLLPVHWGKFSLSLHSWNEPIRRVTKKARELMVPVATPKIGEPLLLGYPAITTEWWNF